MSTATPARRAAHRLVPTIVGLLVTACVAGPAGRCDRPSPAPANLEFVKQSLVEYRRTGAYERDITDVVREAESYLERRAPQVRNPAAVLDIDETSLSNWPELEANQFTQFPDRDEPCDLGRAGSACGHIQWQLKAVDEAVKPVFELYREAGALGVSVFFITGRKDDRDGKMRKATEANLRAAGYMKWAGLALKPGTLQTRSAADFKAPERKKIEDAGYTILINVGDQSSDLAGGHAERSFLLPNPFYTIP